MHPPGSRNRGRTYWCTLVIFLFVCSLEPPRCIAAMPRSRSYFDGDDLGAVIEDGQDMQSLLGGVDWGPNTLSL